MAVKKQTESFDLESKNFAPLNAAITIVLVISVIALILFLING